MSFTTSNKQNHTELCGAVLLLTVCCVCVYVYVYVLCTVYWILPVYCTCIYTCTIAIHKITVLIIYYEYILLCHNRMHTDWFIPIINQLYQRGHIVLIVGHLTKLIYQFNSGCMGLSMLSL